MPVIAIPIRFTLGCQQSCVSDFHFNSADQKVLVFGHHKEVLDAIEQQLKANKPKAIVPVRIDGSVTAAQRAAAVDRFQNDGETRVGLMSIMAAGVSHRFVSCLLMTHGAPQPIVIWRLTKTAARLLMTGKDGTNAVSMCKRHVAHFIEGFHVQFLKAWETVHRSA